MVMVNLIILPLEYIKCIDNIPTQLEKIICDKKYPFADYFKNLGIKISTYILK